MTAPAPSAPAPVATPVAPAAAPAAAPGPRPTISNFHRAMEAKNAAMFAAPTPAPAPTTLQPGPAPANNNAEAPTLLGAPEPGDVAEPTGVDPAAPLDELAPTPEPVPGLTDAEFLAKAREWQSSEYLPDDFLGKLVEVEIKLDDGSKRTEVVTAKELKDGYLRQSALSRAQTRIHHERQQMQARDQNVRTHFERIQDPEVFLQEYENRGYGKTLEQVAIRIAERRRDERDYVNAAGIAAMQRHGCDQNDRRVYDAMQRAEKQIAQSREHELELRRIQTERDQLAAQAQKQDKASNVQELAATMRKQLEQLRPMAFRAHRIHDNASTQKEFARHLLAQMEVAGTFEVTRDAVMTAARVLAEELEDARRSPAPAPRNAPSPNGRALSPTSQIAGRTTTNGATNKRKRPSELMSDLYGKP